MGFIVRSKLTNKGFLAVGISLFCWALFVVFIYMPMLRELKSLRIQVSQTEEKLEHAKQFSSGDIPLEKVETILSERIAELSQKFPSSEEDVIKNFYQQAALYNVDVASLKAAKVATGKQDLLSKMQGDFERININVVLQGSFRQLGGFLESLDEGFANFVIVENLDIEKLPKQGYLKTKARLSAYLKK